MYIYVLDTETCENVVYPLDYRGDADCDLEDEAGNQPNRMINDVAISDEGRGWMEYVWLNPATDRVQTQTSYVIGVAIGDRYASIGAGFYLEE